MQPEQFSSEINAQLSPFFEEGVLVGCYQRHLIDGMLARTGQY